MAKVTRRGFLTSAGAAAGAVALGAAAAGPTLIAAAADAGSPVALSDEPVVAYVRNPKAGEVRLMVGHREVAVKDRALVQRIVSAAG